MEYHKVLLTGDFWHQDFQRIVSGFKIPVTMVPIDKMESVEDSKFDLIVIAQSRRDQWSADEIEQIQATFTGTPVVGLMGSWCEGELRSGTPWPGVIRVYWHQWSGRYETFLNQIRDCGVTDWHAPKTSSVADRISIEKAHIPIATGIQCVGISAWTQTQHEMVADAIKEFGWQSRWVERSMLDGESSKLISAICVEADGWSASLEQRVKWLRSELPNAPMVLLLNYPREDDIKSAKSCGVSHVVSKPFELQDLNSAIRSAAGQKVDATGRTVG